MSIYKKQKKVIKPGLVDAKFFLTSDNYNLSWLGNIKSTAETIILGIHDYGQTRDSFIDLKDYCDKYHNDISVISYDQRNFGQNKKIKVFNYNNLINDLNEIIEYISKEYPEKNLVLIGEGFGSTIVSNFMRRKEIHNVFFCSLYLNQFKKLNINLIFKMLLGIIFSYKIMLTQNLDMNIICDNSYNKISSTLNSYNKKNYKEYLQIKKLNNKITKNFRNSNLKVHLLLPTNDIFINKETYINMFSNIDVNKINIIKLENEKHLFLRGNGKEEIFKTIIKLL
ncbi:serine aminopeptidase domain-containing protein [Spiroplasma turonicum]|uniref:serine aminopeptidase domain-containing protein n=1 Tax=Spiroplasma turonicum TaxID=216946 RepID=UPI00130DD12A|nr:alpha/beta hydrolase [Spiroplasma turonicum]